MASPHTRFDDTWDHAQDEPTLEEMFADPMIQLVIQRDGLHMQEVRQQLDRMLSAQPA